MHFYVFVNYVVSVSKSEWIHLSLLKNAKAKCGGEVSAYLYWSIEFRIHLLHCKKNKRKSHPVKPNHSIPIERKSSKFSFKLPFLFYFHQIHQPIAILILCIHSLLSPQNLFKHSQDFNLSPWKRFHFHPVAYSNCILIFFTPWRQRQPSLSPSPPNHIQCKYAYNVYNGMCV